MHNRKRGPLGHVTRVTRDPVATGIQITYNESQPAWRATHGSQKTAPTPRKCDGNQALVGSSAANENSAQDGFAPADNGAQPELEHAAATDAAEQILGANPLLGLDREELLAAGKRLLRLMTLNPQVLIEENLAFGA